jgi:hypothetical protein
MVSTLVDGINSLTAPVCRMIRSNCYHTYIQRCDNILVITHASLLFGTQMTADYFVIQDKIVFFDSLCRCWLLSNCDLSLVMYN